MTFYFYDLETSGINSKAQRIMQFAGQRTDENFKPIGEPDNWLIKLTDEVLPDPDAILITGITPQKTLEEGYTEAEFLKMFYENVCQPDTIIVGFNNIRFDDEFMRATLWRNLYDPYEWQWLNGCSRWDLLDAIRMIRALRPSGINWPIDEKGQPTNRLELITAKNALAHTNAHDALSDVSATIEVARLLKEKQSKIFEYLLNIRTKKEVSKLVDLSDPKPFLYTSGRYSNKWQKTTAVMPIAPAKNNNVLVFDLRVNAAELASLNDEELNVKLFQRDEETELLPVKVLKINSCPAISPLGVLDEESQKRIGLDIKQIEENFKNLLSINGFAQRVHSLYEMYEEQRSAKYEKFNDVDFQIYDGFLGDKDRNELRAIRSMGENELVDYSPEFIDERLSQLLLRYKVRNYPKSVTAKERSVWDEYRIGRIMKGVSGQLNIVEYSRRLAELSEANASDGEANYLLEELQLWAEAIMPLEEN